MIQKYIPYKYDILGALSVMLLTAIFFLPVTNKEVLFDSPTYLRVAQHLVETHQLIIMSHFLYPLMVGVIKVLFHLDYWLAGAVIVVLFEVFLALVLYVFVRIAIKKPVSLGASLWSMVVALSLLLAAHIPLLAFWDRHLYFGYIGINVYHNATMAVLKPLALLLFYAGAQVYLSRSKSVILILACAVLTVMTASAKPSFIVDLLPVLGLFTLYRMIKKQWINWPLLVFGIGLPMVLSLGWQYWFTYMPSNNAAEGDWRVIVAPFAVYRAWSDWLFVKFFLSVLFPLGVFLLYLPKVLKDMELLLAWLVFLFGATYGYLLAEEGVRFAHGNFVWSAQIGLFILFVYTVLFLIKRSPFNDQKDPGQTPRSVRKFWISVGLYGIHLIGGIVWYVNHLGIFGDIFKLW